MQLAFLSTLQPAFVADRIHHNFALCRKEIGCHDEHAEYDTKKHDFGQQAPLTQFQPIKGESGDKQSGQQQDHTGIAKTVKGFEKLHCELPALELGFSMPLAATKDKEIREKIMSDVQIRAAIVQDAAAMAHLDNVASHGLSQWYWQKQSNDDGGGEGGEGGKGGKNNQAAEDWLALSQAMMAKDYYPSGWTNSVIAEIDGEIAGAASGCLTKDDGEKIGILPEPLFEPIFELFQEAAGDWLLDWLAVNPSEQGRGIGGMLLDVCLENARAAGARRASLVVEDSNITALKLYYSRGFQKRDQRPYIPFNETSQTQNWLLLSAPVTKGNDHG